MSQNNTLRISELEKQMKELNEELKELQSVMMGISILTIALQENANLSDIMVREKWTEGMKRIQKEIEKENKK